MAESLRTAFPRADVQIVRDGANTHQMARRALRHPLLLQRGNSTAQRDNAIADGDADVGRIHAGFPFESREHFVLKIPIAFHGTAS